MRAASVGSSAEDITRRRQPVATLCAALSGAALPPPSPHMNYGGVPVEASARQSAAPARRAARAASRRGPERQSIRVQGESVRASMAMREQGIRRQTTRWRDLALASTREREGEGAAPRGGGGKARRGGCDADAEGKAEARSRAGGVAAVEDAGAASRLHMLPAPSSLQGSLEARDRLGITSGFMSGSLGRRATPPAVSSRKRAAAPCRWSPPARARDRRQPARKSTCHAS